jgi:hypothetical protein
MREGAYPNFVEAERFGVTDVTMFARLGRGQSLILQGRVTEGTALLDEVMVAVKAGEVSPIDAGIAYCRVIELCQKGFDVSLRDLPVARLARRIRRGPASVHLARRANRVGTLGAAYHQLGEIQRLHGELAQAEAAYRQASLAGREPEPGMS